MACSSWRTIASVPVAAPNRVEWWPLPLLVMVGIWLDSIVIVFLVFFEVLTALIETNISLLKACALRLAAAETAVFGSKLGNSLAGSCRIVELSAVVYFFLKGKAESIGIDGLVEMDAEDAAAVAILKPFSRVTVCPASGSMSKP